MGETSFIMRGNFAYSIEKDTIKTVENGSLVCVDNKVAGVYEQIPECYEGLPVKDYHNRLIVPGLTDLHIHAPQYSYRGLGMDMELLDWLNNRTFPEESKYRDLDYAKQAYKIFSEDMKQGDVTRACIFGTIHVPATVLLMQLMEGTGLKTMVGKVNMDRNSPDILREESAKTSVGDTLQWLEEVRGRFENVMPILTPRFIPTCTDELMQGLRELQKAWRLPLQSHLSENQGEIAWVKELCPQSAYYGAAYERFGVLDPGCKTIMAHCVSSSQEELDLLKRREVYVAHCPQSNTNLSSGIAPVRAFLEQGLKVGLGSDVAGGTSGSIFRAMADAIQASKLRWRLVDDGLRPLTVEEAFYLGTKGGGAFFGNVGSFEPGYELDALVLDDENLRTPRQLTVKERLERSIYLSDNRNIVGKFVAGRQIL